jgi:hypothetical protein
MNDSLTDRVGPIVETLGANLSSSPRVESDEVHLNGAVDWLCQSQNVTDTSGSAATYNLLLGWEDPYPETSGYIVPTLFEYADRYDDTEIRNRAISMADWTLSTQHANGSFPGGTGGDGDPNAFNTGQIILGLASAYERTGEEAYLDAVRDACDWLVDVQDEAGHWASFDYKSTPHVYAARIAWPLAVGADLVEDDGERYRDAARTTFQWVMDNQQANGWFDHASFESDEDPFLHTIAYTVRGLIEGGRALDDDEIVECGKRTADKLLELQLRDGNLKGAYDAHWSPSWYYCLTGNAQMAIVWARLYELTGDSDYLLGARTAVQFLKRHQLLDASTAIQGGLPGSYPIVGRYIYLRYPNWGTKFLADALLELQALEGQASGDRTPTTEPPETSQPLQMCVLVDGEHVFRWVAEAIEHLLEETDTEIPLVVINEDTGLLSSGNVKRGK